MMGTEEAPGLTPPALPPEELPVEAAGLVVTPPVPRSPPRPGLATPTWLAAGETLFPVELEAEVEATFPAGAAGGAAESPASALLAAISAAACSSTVIDLGVWSRIGS